MKTSRIIGLVLAIALIIAGFIILSSPKQGVNTSNQDGQTFNDSATNTESSAPKRQTSQPRAGDTIAILKTDKGDIFVKLFTSDVPKISQNFIELAKQGKYNGVTFHRIIKDFMIQTGDFQNHDGTGGYSYKGAGTSMSDEFSDYRHIKGAVSMANSGPNTNGSQFFIVSASAGTPWLDGVHSIFGQVYKGIDVVDKISDVKVEATDDGSQPSVPIDPPVIKSVTIEKVK